MTTNPLDLTKRDCVLFTFSHGGQVPGEVLSANTHFVRIQWEDGWTGTYTIDDRTFWSRIEAVEP